MGELKIPGYSAYLHPVGEELLLGVGQEATGDGRVQGLQLSLFDVSDLAHPTRLQQRRIGERWSHSAAEWDHHAFLWWPATKLAVLPIDSQDFIGAAGYRVDRARGISELGRVSHDDLGASWTPSISRAVVVGPRLFTMSDLGVKASGLESFAGAGWAAFPQPPEPPYPIDGPMPVPMPAGSGRLITRWPRAPAARPWCATACRARPCAAAPRPASPRRTRPRAGTRAPGRARAGGAGRAARARPTVEERMLVRCFSLTALTSRSSARAFSPTIMPS